MTAHRKLTRPRVLVVTGLVVLMIGPGAAAEPVGVGQADPPSDDDLSTDRTLVAIESDAGAADIINELDALAERVSEQLERLEEAEKALDKAISDLADADAALNETEMRLEQLTVMSDEIVISAFVSPPAQDALDVLSAESVGDATIKSALLDIEASQSADVLSELDAVRAELEERKEKQEGALSKAEAARADAEAALADLQAGVSQQTEFVLQVMARGDLDLADLDAAAREREERLAARLREMQEAEEYAMALQKLKEAEERAQEQAAAEAEAAAEASSTGWVCPVRGELSFNDTWGAARSGGRSHQGTDIMAASGTPTVAPVSGRVEHRSSSLGGYSWYVYGDDGNTYFGTHLSGYENQGAGRVARGTVIGYVGSSGNASTPHLHFEYHPGGGSPVNPYPYLVEVC